MAADDTLRANYICSGSEMMTGNKGKCYWTRTSHSESILVSINDKRCVKLNISNKLIEANEQLKAL